LIERRQIDSPDRLNEDIVEEFKNRSKPINLINIERKVWTSKVIYFDKDNLYVRVPPNFECPLGGLILVEFPTKGGSYVIQSFISKIKTPILGLKFQDPRKYARFRPPSVYALAYAKVDNDLDWLNDKNGYIIRTMEEENEGRTKVSIKDTIGSLKKVSEDGSKVISLLEGKTDELQRSVKKTDLHDISLGGCAIKIKDGDINKNDMVYMNLNIPNDNFKIKEIDLLLFGIVKNVIPFDENRYRLGVSFIKQLRQEPFERFFQKMH